MGRRSGRIAACVVMGSIVALGGFAHLSEAALGSCRADPVLHLSNGGALRVFATIGVDRRAVGRITYTVRVPRGLRLLATTYTAGTLGAHETIYFSADNAPGTFSTDTLVSTPGLRAAVTASITVQGARGTATGHSGDHLLITLYRQAPAAARAALGVAATATPPPATPTSAATTSAPGNAPETTPTAPPAGGDESDTAAPKATRKA